MHGPRNDGIRFARIHRIQQTVDGLVSVEAQDSGTEDFLGVRVDDDLDEATCITELSGAANTALTDHAPEFAEGWNARATAFYLMNQYGLSVADIQRTPVLNPRHFGAMSGLGAILEQTGRLKDALTVYTRALEIHPHQPGVIEAVERLNAEVGGTTL